MQKEPLIHHPESDSVGSPRGTGGLLASRESHTSIGWVFRSASVLSNTSTRPGQGDSRARAAGTGQTGRLELGGVTTCTGLTRKCYHGAVSCGSVVHIVRAQFLKPTLLLEDRDFMAPPPGCALGGHHQAQAAVWLRLWVKQLFREKSSQTPQAWVWRRECPH